MEKFFKEDLKMKEKKRENGVIGYEVQTQNEEMYKVIEFSENGANGICIRKYGERKGINIGYTNERELKTILVGYAIENYILKQRLKKAKKALK